ncbi:acyl-CoA thioesterase [Pseudoroseomonas sp. WGS1072]|uniref:acyl-CoA thioesterase n=1 Tax=Roseomonas sp. WGS1072 TaxID=3366816 RepID=UPI003BF04052
MAQTPPRRSAYRWFLDMPTRWGDQDSQGHVNNAAYYFYFDTLVARFLHGLGRLGAGGRAETFVVVETLCRHHAPAFFPDVLSGGLRVARIGQSSIRYEIGLFRPGQETACAEGHFIHVQVDAATQARPLPVAPELREALAPLMAPDARRV